jgi:hypothetical protein
MTGTRKSRDLRRQRDAVAMNALVALLKDICKEPDKHHGRQLLSDAVKSQGALARFEHPAAHIHRMSLNHQKSVAEQVLGSYEVLDNLRRAAGGALSAERHRGKLGRTTTKEHLKDQIKVLEQERTALLEDLLLLQRAFDQRCLQARIYASKADKSTMTLCAKEQREIDMSLSLRRRDSPKTTVVSIHGAPKNGRT